MQTCMCSGCLAEHEETFLYLHVLYTTVEDTSCDMMKVFYLV